MNTGHVGIFHFCTSPGSIRKAMLVLMISITLLFADRTTDSLYQAIDEYNGLPEIEARLELAYAFRKSDHIESLNQSEIALKEAIKLNDQNLQAKALYYRGLACYHNDLLDSALTFFAQSAELYRNDNNYSQLAKVKCMQGTNYLSVTGDQNMAISHYNEALVYARKASDHITMAMIYSQLSNIFRMNGAYQQAIEFIYKSKEHYETVGYHEGVAWILYSVGRIYTTMSLYEEAQNEFLRGLEKYKSLPESVSSLTGVAICYDELGLTSLELGDIESARSYNLKAREIYREIGSEFGMSNAYKYLARIDFQVGDYDRALESLNKSLNLKKNINDVLGYPGVYNLYGQIFKEKKQYANALDSLNVGMKYAIGNSQKNRIISINKCLAEIYSETGDYQKAYQFRSREVAIIDSIQQSKATRALTQLENFYDLEARESLIEKLEREKHINEIILRREVTVRNLLLIILTMTIVFVFFFLKLYASNRQTNEILKQNQKELQELNATKDKFTSIIAHDLKSPFNSILGFSTLLEKYSKKGDQEKVLEFTGHIQEVSSQTYKLLENLLEWSRSQTGKISFKPKALDIKIPVKNACDLMNPVAQRKGIKFEINVPTIAVHVDENMMHTILQNLLSNAIKYSYKNGKIYIDAYEKNNKLFLKIRDDGVGMDEQSLQRLFHIDENISTIGTEGEKGTGLGLILSKEFIERHRGKLSVTSEEGKGSCFTIELPL